MRIDAMDPSGVVTFKNPTLIHRVYALQYNFGTETFASLFFMTVKIGNG